MQALILSTARNSPSLGRAVFLCVGVILLLAGCFPVQQKLAWEPFPTYAPHKIEDMVVHPPATLLQGEGAPWDGLLLHPDDFTVLLDERDRLIDALRISYQGRTEDREYAAKALDAAQTALTVCRKNLPRAFVAGAGAGAAACGVTTAIVAGAVSR